jgi:orotate phosphoribosyltransferase
MMNMLNFEQARAELFALLKLKSVFHGEFKLASGGTSNYYVDCKLTTFDPKCAWLVGQVVHHLIRQEEAARQTRIDSIGGLTMGSDPIALATGMFSVFAKDPQPFQTFSVRKTQKSHGQGKLIEGSFRPEDTVVIIDDVVTRGESTIAAINAVTQAGAKIAFIVALVDRQEGGRDRIEQMGYSVLPVFRRDELLGNPA